MGYTHYWAFDAAAGVDEGFARTAVDATRIIAAARIPLAADPDEPTQPPQVTTQIIRLNGIGEDGHETFALRRNPARDATEWHAQQAAERGYWWGYCKTHRQGWSATSPRDSVEAGSAILSSVRSTGRASRCAPNGGRVGQHHHPQPSSGAIAAQWQTRLVAVMADHLVAARPVQEERQADAGQARVGAVVRRLHRSLTPLSGSAWPWRAMSGRRPQRTIRGGDPARR